MSKLEQQKKTASETSPQVYSPVVELRQYTLHPGQRDALIDLFERVFIEAQEAIGMTVIGQFRDQENPNRFVWLRGFPDMVARHAALEALYSGPIWKANREAANAAIVDSDNVLLLHPARPTWGFNLDPGSRPSSEAEQVPAGLVVATILCLKTAPSADMLDWFEETLAPTLSRSGATMLAAFVTEASTNTFPALPVREGEQVFVWFSGFPGQAVYDEYVAAQARSQEEQERLWAPVKGSLKAAPQTLRLSPTRRSLVRG